MSQEVTISDAEMKALQEAASLHNRSISAQAESWLRLGRAFAQDARLGDFRIQAALNGLISPMDLSTDEEQEAYFEGFATRLSSPSPTEDAFFKDRQMRGLGVGMDEAGNIIEQKPTKVDPS